MPAESRYQPLRMAVLTESVSHFEAPLFRLCAQREELTFKVFYIQSVERRPFDAEYGGVIDWGDDLLAGYDSAKLGDAQALSRAGREWGADVILMYGYGWRGAPRIILENWWRGQAQVHRGTLNYLLDPRRPLKGRLMRPFRNVLLKRFDAHHFGGSYSRKVLLDAGASEASLFFVPYSVDSRHFLAESDSERVWSAARALRTERGWSGDDRVILFVGHHSWVKGPDIAVDTFRQVAQVDPRARFLIVGSGRMTEEMKEAARRGIEPSRVHFAGFVPSMEATSYYLASDIVLCSSRYETWARMINEAMLCRRPCVVSRVVAASGGLIEDGVTGYVVTKPDATQFAEAIARYFALNTTERRRVGEAARKRAQAFAYEPSMDSVVAAARYAMAQRGHSKPAP